MFKKATCLTLAAWIFGFSVLSAAPKTAEVESFEVSESLSNEFKELEQLESEIKTIGLNDYNSLVNENSEFSSELRSLNIASVNSVNAIQNTTSVDMDWGAFAWGLLCCPIGFFVVAINKNKTSDQKASFWIGWGVGVAVNLIYYAAVGGPGN